MPLPRPAPGTGRWWAIGIVGCTLGAGLATWLALANTLGAVTWDDTGYAVLDDRSVQVDFDVHRTPGDALSCTIQALDASFGVVGTLQVSVPAARERSTHQQVIVRTTSRAVTGVVKSCTTT